MTDLTSKIVVITGAGGGFGREMIAQLLRAGSYLILADRDGALLHAATASIAPVIGQVQGKILGYAIADLADERGCDELYRQVRAITPQIDILINNAGIACGGPFTAIPVEQWERLMQVNLLAPIRLTTKFLPDMIARRSGHIVNVSSVAGLIGTPGLVAYSTAKWGLRGFGEALANEVEMYGIAVTTIYPYFARTPILDAPQFGVERQSLPNWMLYEPHVAVAALIAGIRGRQRHVYPGAIPKVIGMIQRFSPWAIPRLTQPLNPNRRVAVAPSMISHSVNRQ
jgi:short-subunit dehydrogenase